jgi:hypothetical protein
MQHETTRYSAEGQHARRWLVVFFGTLTSFAFLTVAVLLAEIDRLPAPQLTTNLSFNEKMRWAREALVEGKCDTLVLGSSMALNSLDTAELARKGYLPAANLGAWGLGVIANRRLIDLVLNLCTPKRIIYPFYYGDFGPVGGTDFDPVNLKLYLHTRGASSVPFYMRGITLVQLWRDYWTLAMYRRSGAGAYTNLGFDEAGAALLSCSNFQRDAGRWDGFMSRTVHISPEAMQAFVGIIAVAREHGIPLTVMETPMRGAARDALEVDLAALRARVSVAVHDGGAHFVPAPADMSDDMFADYAHLNRCGAAVWTQVALPQLGD